MYNDGGYGDDSDDDDDVVVHDDDVVDHDYVKAAQYATTMTQDAA
jgi:hypothetical protein